jgi:uncharacterized phage-like protein YoqJ
MEPHQRRRNDSESQGSGLHSCLFERERKLELIISGTGHRPQKLGGYSPEIHLKLRRFLTKQLDELQPDKVLSGMALGFDQALAFAAVDLAIPFAAIVPFESQGNTWTKESQAAYLKLLALASDIVIVSKGGFGPNKMQKRNEYLVDHCDLLLTLWNGSPSGTGRCIQYAEKKQREIKHLWPEWLRIEA